MSPFPLHCKSTPTPPPLIQLCCLCVAQWSGGPPTTISTSLDILQLHMFHSQLPHVGDSAAPTDYIEEVRDIYALTSSPHPSSSRADRRESWEVGSHRSSTPSLGSEIEQFSTISREFNAMVVAGSTQLNDNNDGLGRIGEEEMEETNMLAIVPGNNPIPLTRRTPAATDNTIEEEVPLHRVKKEEVESKISAWQTAKIAKINNRFKRDDVMINGWESEQFEKATTRLNKVERKLDEKRARALEKMQNDTAKARRKAEEKRASAEGKRGTKVARVSELANLMRTVGRPPSKRSVF